MATYSVVFYNFNPSGVVPTGTGSTFPGSGPATAFGGWRDETNRIEGGYDRLSGDFAEATPATGRKPLIRKPVDADEANLAGSSI